MCLSSPDVPPAPPPLAPSAAPKIKNPTQQALNVNASGQAVRRVNGLSSLRVDRIGSSFNIPQ